MQMRLPVKEISMTFFLEKKSAIARITHKIIVEKWSSRWIIHGLAPFCEGILGAAYLLVEVLHIGKP